MAISNRELSKARSQLVVKDNTLITKARYNLTVQQQKILLYMISLIKPNHIPGQRYEISISDFCEITGIAKNNGMYLQLVKKDIKSLADESAWIELDDGTETLFRWIESSDDKLKIGKGKVQYEFTKRAEEYLFDLKSRYTSYELIQVLAFRCKYAIRLYEYLKVFSYKAYPYNEEDPGIRGFKDHFTVSIDVDDFKKIMGCDNYKRFVDLKKNVIEKALEEINNLTTDMRIECSYRKVGKKVKTIVFEYLPVTITEEAAYIRRRVLNRTIKRGNEKYLFSED